MVVICVWHACFISILYCIISFDNLLVLRVKRLTCNNWNKLAGNCWGLLRLLGKLCHLSRSKMGCFVAPKGLGDKMHLSSSVDFLGFVG